MYLLLSPRGSLGVNIYIWVQGSSRSLKLLKLYVKWFAYICLLLLFLLVGVSITSIALKIFIIYLFKLGLNFVRVILGS